MSLYFLIYLGINKFMEIFMNTDQNEIQPDPMMTGGPMTPPPMNPM